MTEVSESPRVDVRMGSRPGEQATRYVAWILSAFVVNLTITCVLTYVAGFRPQTAFLISLIIITTINFFGLRSFVYRARDEPLGKQVVRYLITNGFQRSLEYGLFHLAYVLGDPPVYLATPAVLAFSTLMRFFIYRHFVFKPKRPDPATNVAAGQTDAATPGSTAAANSSTVAS